MFKGYRLSTYYAPGDETNVSPDSVDAERTRHVNGAGEGRQGFSLG